MEKHFYRKKLTDLLNGKKLFHHIKEFYKSKSKKNIKNENEKDINYFHSSQKFFRNINLYNNYRYNDDQRLKTVRSEKIFEESKKNYEKFLKEKYIKQAKILADSLCDIKDLPEKVLNGKNKPDYYNLNMKNLGRVIQVHSIKKHLYSVEDDDLLVKNTKKLREEIRNTESGFYSMCRGNYNCDFLKGK